jgi:benzoyl-CoA reductase subunit C
MFDTLVKCERDRHDYAKEWKERTGGKVLGYFQVYFPEELAHAAVYFSSSSNEDAASDE